jgi:uncharacterized protein YejL (UPF0352 family)
MSALKDRQRKLLTVFHANNARNSFATIQHLYGTAEDILNSLLTEARDKINAEYDDFKEKHPDDINDQSKVDAVKASLLEKYFPDIKSEWDKVITEVEEDVKPIVEIAKRYLVSYGKEHSMVLMPSGLGSGSPAPYEPSPIQNIFFPTMPILGTDKTLLDIPNDALTPHFLSSDIRLRELNNIEDFENLLQNTRMRSGVLEDPQTPLSDAVASALLELEEQGFTSNPFKVGDSIIEVNNPVILNGYPILDIDGNSVTFSDLLDPEQLRKIGVVSSLLLIKDENGALSDYISAQSPDRVKRYHIDDIEGKYYQKSVDDILHDLKMAYLVNHDDFSLKMRGRIAMLWLKTEGDKAHAFTQLMHLSPDIREVFVDDLLDFKKEILQQYGPEQGLKIYRNQLSKSIGTPNNKLLIGMVIDTDIENPKTQELLNDVFSAYIETNTRNEKSFFGIKIVRQALDIAVPTIFPSGSENSIKDMIPSYKEFVGKASLISERIEKKLASILFLEKEQKRAIDKLSDFSDCNNFFPINGVELDKVQYDAESVKKLITSVLTHAIVSDLTVNLSSKILDSTDLFSTPMKFRYIDTNTFKEKACFNVLSRIIAEDAVEKLNNIVGVDLIDKSNLFKTTIQQSIDVIKRMNVPFDSISIFNENGKGGILFSSLIDFMHSDKPEDIKSDVFNLITKLIDDQFEGMKESFRHSNKTEKRTAYKHLINDTVGVLEKHPEKDIALIAVYNMLNMEILPSNYRSLIRAAENTGISMDDVIPGKDKTLIEHYVSFIDGYSDRPETADKFFGAKKAEYMQGIAESNNPTKKELDDEDLNHLFGKTL